MDHGVLHQVGTPLEVYDAPANLFVAQFLGSPGMNLLPGRLDGAAVELEGGGRIALTGAEARAAERAPGRDVVYGFRPEEARLSSESLTRPVEVIERIGARTILHLSGGAKAVFGNDVEAAERAPVTLAPAPGTASLFDAASGARLGARAVASIEFRGVTKRYGDTVAVDDASFRIEDNEFFCLFGPPLCGKSTILRLILELQAPMRAKS